MTKVSHFGPKRAYECSRSLSINQDESLQGWGLNVQHLGWMDGTWCLPNHAQSKCEDLICFFFWNFSVLLQLHLFFSITLKPTWKSIWTQQNCSGTTDDAIQTGTMAQLLIFYFNTSSTPPCPTFIASNESLEITASPGWRKATNGGAVTPHVCDQFNVH